MLIVLNEHICVLKNQKIIISSKINASWSLLAWGKFIHGD